MGLIWSLLNDIFSTHSTGPSVNILLIFVGSHVLLAVATLALGDKTVCDILHPLLKIFKPDAQSLLDGVLDVTIAIPSAVIYYAALYIRAYFLLARLAFLVMASAIPALLTWGSILVVLQLIYHTNASANVPEGMLQIATLSIYPIWVFWYWRIDGKSILLNFRKSFDCIL